MNGGRALAPARRILSARTLPGLLVGLQALVLGACVAVHEATPMPAVAPAAGLSVQILDRLYFGRDIPGGGNVSDRDWTAFLAEIVTPRFPSGLTVLRGDGQWRDAAGAIAHEPSFVLELIHPEDAATERAVREIADEYKRRFSQESVLRVRDHVEVSF